MIISVCFFQESDIQFVQLMELKLPRKQLSKWLTGLLTYPERTKIQVLSPVISGKKGAHVKVLEDIKKQGYVRVRVDGEMYDLE